MAQIVAQTSVGTLHQTAWRTLSFLAPKHRLPLVALFTSAASISNRHRPALVPRPLCSAPPHILRAAITLTAQARNSRTYQTRAFLSVRSCPVAPIHPGTRAHIVLFHRQEPRNAGIKDSSAQDRFRHGFCPRTGRHRRLTLYDQMPSRILPLAPFVA